MTSPPPKAIWVRLPRFIGDGVMISQSLEPLRQAGFPLVAWGPPAVVDLYRGSNAFTAVQADDPKARGAFALARLLRAGEAAAVIGFARSLRPLLAGWLARIPLRVGWREGGGWFFGTHTAPWWQRHLHHLDRYEGLLRRAFPDLPRAVQPLPFRPRPEAEAAVAERLRTLGLDSGFVALALGGNEWNKRLEAGPWVGLIHQLREAGLPAVLLGQGPEDQALAQEILAQTPWVPTLVDELKLAETAALLGRCRGLVGNDSAVTHLGGAMHVPTVTTFGPTRPEWAAPRGGEARVVRLEGLPCLPCGDHGCKVEGHPCMRELPPEALFAALSDILRPVPSETA